MSEEVLFWQSSFGKLLRWLSFLPIGIILGIILQVLPSLAIGYARMYKFELNLLDIIIVLIAVSLLGTLSWMWFLAVLMTPYLSCRVIAPNNKVAAVIYGTIFCLVQGLFLLKLFLADGQSWVFIGYQLAFSGILVSGTVLAYKEDEYS